MTSAPLALSNGDFMPQNSRLVDGRVRLLDFEGAVFQHVLLAAAQLRVPYAAAPAWSRLPPEVSRLAEQAYRERLVTSCPRIGDDQVFAEGMAAASAAWAVNRLTLLPRLSLSRSDALIFRRQLSVGSTCPAWRRPAVRRWWHILRARTRRPA